MEKEIPLSDPAVKSEVLHFLETSGLKKTASRFRKESGVETADSGSLPEAFLPLSIVIINARRKYAKKALKRSGQGSGKQKDGRKDLMKDGTKQTRGENKKNKEIEKENKKEEASKRKGQEIENRQLKKDVEEFVSQLKFVKEDVKEPSKKRKKSPTAASTEESPDAVKRKRLAEQPSGTPEAAIERTENGSVHFKRVDEEKWWKAIKDDRLKNQSYSAKQGDKFVSKAAAELGKVRGKDFRKEMQKKKRSSWKGTGEMDMGVNSVAFSSESD